MLIIFPIFIARLSFNEFRREGEMNTADTSENCQQTSFVANSELQNVYNFCENEQKIMNNSNNNSSDSNNQHCNHRNHHLHDDSVEGHLDDIRKTEQCKNDDNDDDDAHRLLALELNAGEKHEREQKATLTNAMKAPRETLVREKQIVFLPIKFHNSFLL